MDKFEIKLGLDFADEIRKGIQNSKTLVCLITKNYLNSENCINEFKLGKHFKKRLFLVMFERISLEETSIGYFAVGIQRYNLYKNKNSLNFALSTDFEEFLRELLKSVNKTDAIDLETLESKTIQSEEIKINSNEDKTSELETHL